MTRATRYGLRALVMASAAIASVAVAAPATAVPIVTTPHCESGASRYFCFITVSGTSGPVTIRWTIGGTPIPAFNDLRSVSGPCTPNQVLSVKVVVTDATGSTTKNTGFRCSSGPWP